MSRVYRRTSIHFHCKTIITVAYENSSTCNNKLVYQTRNNYSIIIIIRIIGIYPRVHFTFHSRLAKHIVNL